MKTVLLTTDTTHHKYYAWKLAEQVPLEAIVIETKQASPPFNIYHPFERERDEYEKEILLRGCTGSWREFAPILQFSSANDADCVGSLEKLRPDVTILFGVGRLRPSVLRAAGGYCVNLHGGNPEMYRGLDSHLWAIYHGDFGNLSTTLHHVGEELDTGDIAFLSQLRIAKGTPLAQLRSINTKVCLDLSMMAFNTIRSTGVLPAEKQKTKGRYYSFMPTVLKEYCLEKFNRYVERI